MRVGTMTRDVLASLFRRPATQRYPFERREAPDHLRGELLWNPEKCTGCGLCAKDCPSDAIQVHILDRAKKQFVMEYHIDRCTFCAQCVQNCRFKCLRMSSEHWELASLDKDPFTVYYGDDANIETLLGNLAQPPAEPALQES